MGNSMRAIFLIFGATFCMALIGLLGKECSRATSVRIALFFRFFMPTLLLLPFIFQMRRRFWQWHLLRYQLVRAFFVLLTQACYFFYLSRGSLFNALLLYNTGPLFMPLLAFLALKKELSLKLLKNITIGFIGVAFILKPDKEFFNFSSLIGLGTGFFMACSQLALHKITRITKTGPQLLLLFFLCTIFSLFPILTNLTSILRIVDVKWVIFLGFISLGAASIGNQFFRSLAYRYVNNPSILAPFFYFSLVFALIFDWVIYHKLPDLLAIFGAILIILSTLSTSRKRGKPSTGD